MYKQKIRQLKGDTRFFYGNAMKITIDTNDGFAVDIMMDEEDASKDKQEIAFELLAAIFALCETYVNKLTNVSEISKKTDIIF